MAAGVVGKGGGASPHLPRVTPLGWRHVVPVVGLAVLFRAFNAATLGTYANPDEHWQAPEVAHARVFGSGFVTWEWWPQFEIRSSSHAWVFAAVYWVLQACGWASPAVVASVPHAIHAVCAVVVDVAVYAITVKLAVGTGWVRHPHRVALLAVWASLTSWFTWFAAPRAFINNLEAALSAVGLALWIPSSAVRCHRHPAPTSLSRALVLGCVVGFTVGTRPSAAMFWAPMIGCAGLRWLGWAGCRMGAPPDKSFPQLVAVAAGGVVGMVATAALDTAWYGHPTATWVNFFRVNLLYGVDALYGVYPRAWYLYAGLPVVVAAAMPPVVVAVWALTHPPCTEGGRQRVHPSWLDMGVACMVYVVALSGASHKEQRFLLPLLPCAHVAAGVGLYVLSSWVGDPLVARWLPRGACDGCMAPGPQGPQVCRTLPLRLLWRAFVVIGVVASALGGTYVNAIHQRGPIDVIAHLRSTLPQGVTHPPTTVLFLMPCHSTPFHAALHRHGVVMRQLDCAPVLSLEGGEGPSKAPSRSDTESEWLRTNPSALLRHLFNCTSPPRDGCLPAPPTHVVMYDVDARVGVWSSWLERHGYAPTATFFHSHVQGDVHSTASPRSIVLFQTGESRSMVK